MSVVGAFLKDLRIGATTSLEQVADLVHISRSHLASVEKGKAHPTLFELFALAAYHGVEEKDLLIRHLSGQTAGEQMLLRKVLKGTASKNLRYSNMIRDLEQLQHPHSEFRFYSPNATLAPYVEHMIFFNTSNGGKLAKILPDRTTKLFISVDDGQYVLKDGNSTAGRSLVREYWLVGPRTRPLLLAMETNKRLLCVNFRPGGLYGLTGRSQKEMANVIENAELFFGPSLVKLRDHLCRPGEAHEKFQVVEQYLTAKTPKNNDYQRLINCIYKHIHQPIGELAKRTGYSQKHLTTLLKKYTGLTPKYFQRIHRFNEVLDTLQRLPEDFDWHRLVVDNNYFDQAHFIHEFRQFTDMNPQSYLEAASLCPKFLPLNR